MSYVFFSLFVKALISSFMYSWGDTLWGSNIVLQETYTPPYWHWRQKGSDTYSRLAIDFLLADIHDLIIRHFERNCGNESLIIRQFCWTVSIIWRILNLHEISLAFSICIFKWLVVNITSNNLHRVFQGWLRAGQEINVCHIHVYMVSTTFTFPNFLEADFVLTNGKKCTAVPLIARGSP
jgi:hypothetical protein